MDLGARDGAGAAERHLDLGDAGPALLVGNLGVVRDDRVDRCGPAFGCAQAGFGVGVGGAAVAAGPAVAVSFATATVLP